MTSVDTAGSTILAGTDLAKPRAHAGRELAPLFTALRREDPVAWHETSNGSVPGFWVVSRHADVSSLARDTTRLSSARGNMLTTLLADGDSAGNRMLVVSDPPRHHALRNLMREAFTPKALAPLGERIRESARELWRTAAERGHCDVATDIAARIPLGAICDLLGVPEADHAFVLKQTSAALSSHEPVPTSFAARMAQAEILLYFAKLARRRAAEPADDVVSLLAHGLVDGEALTEDELVLNCYSLILGGDETTRLSMIGAVQALAEHPDQWARLRDGEVEVADAVEELLRWTTAVLHQGRTATADLELHGRRIRAGDIVTLWTCSANQDETAFAAPGRLDLGRRPNRQLAFGYGPHFCLGAHLARIELTALLKAMRETVAEVELDGPGEPIYSNFLTGYAALPVRLERSHNGR
ncbi:MAG TPA: cytochrome P450 [Actinospica sp.]|jgi:cytochrome P450|nr:cytochrome P450 [Actinospica sp.]